MQPTWTLNCGDWYSPHPFLSSVTNWQNKYINVPSHYFSSVALCFLVTVKRGPWRQDGPVAVYQWKSNIIHKQRSGNQYFITKLLVRMKRNGWGDFFFGSLLRAGCQEEFNVRCNEERLSVRGIQAGKLKLRHLSCNGNQNNNNKKMHYFLRKSGYFTQVVKLPTYTLPLVVTISLESSLSLIKGVPI